MKKIIKIGFVFTFLMSAYCAMAALHGPSSDPGDPEFGGGTECDNTCRKGASTCYCEGTRKLDMTKK